MKFIYSLLAVLCISYTGFGQVVLIHPLAEGGFETGTTFTSNGWSFANPLSVTNNNWIVGTGALPYGARCAYITNDGLGTYAYTLTTASTAHFYRDVVIPTGSTNITLNFVWKGSGEAGLDQLFISTAPTSVSPAANVPVSPSNLIPGATVLWTQPSFTLGAFTPETIILPTSLAGSTVRLIFSWETNGSGGASPGAAVDSVSLKYDCPAPADIVGDSIICTGNTLTLTDASPVGAWTSSNPSVGAVSSAGVVSGLAQGTTIISYTTACLAPATKVVTVNNNAAAITGPTKLCISSTATFGETSTGGTWTSSNSSVAPVSSSGVVSADMYGSTIIQYDNGCGAPATLTISVTTTPPIITGPGSVCEGGATIAILDTYPTGTWSSDVPGIATVVSGASGTGIITGITAGTVIISYFPDTMCAVSTVITVNPLPAPISGIVPICVGNSMYVSNTAGGGLWYSSVPGVATIDPFTGLVSGLAGGTTTISYVNGCGTGTSIITIDPIPAPITGFDSVCIGSHTTLADVTIGGTWSSSNHFVASVVSGGTSGLLTGVAEGTTTITYMMPGGCYSVTEVTSFLFPSAIIGLAALCPGSTTTLSNSISGGTWASANPSVATIGSSNGVVIAVSSDTVGMLYTTPYGCTAYGVVTVNPIPLPILGISKLCPTQTDTLSDLSPGGTWASLNGSVAGIDATTGVVTANAGGVATIKYTLPTGCLRTDVVTVNPLPVPVVSFNTAINTFFASAGYTSYQWYNSLGIIPGATTDHTAGIVNGFYFVIVTDDNGCAGSSANVPYNVSMGVMHVGEASEVKVYPNPSSGIVYIQSVNAVRAVVCSMDGRKIIDQDNATKIDISKLQQGLYLITLFDESGNQLKVEKLTKE